MDTKKGFNVCAGLHSYLEEEQRQDYIPVGVVQSRPYHNKAMLFSQMKESMGTMGIIEMKHRRQ